MKDISHGRYSTSFGRLFCFIVYTVILSFLQHIVSYLSGGTECLTCDRHTYAVPLCSECRRHLFRYVPFNSERRCRICGKELISEKDICLSCREKALLLQTDGVFPIFSYRLWNKQLLFAWKMNGVRTLSPVFASLVHKAVIEIEKIKEEPCIPIVPVPPRPGKIKEKGWDQIDELCRFLSGRYKHTVLPLLVRNSVEQQKKRGRMERLEKIKSEYSLVSQKKRDKIISNVIPQTVLLLDDVMTTGATVEKCASVLKTIGIKQVCVLTLFIVD